MADIARPLTASPHVTTQDHLKQIIQDDEIGSINREYNFFVTTDSQHQPEGMDRGLIRRLVMRNFFDTRGASAEVETCASANNSAKTVLAKKQLKSRFRLTNVAAEPKKSRNRSESKSKETHNMIENEGTEKVTRAKAKKKRPKASRTTFSSTNTSSNSTSISPTNVFPAWQSPSSTHASAKQHTVFCQNPSTQLIDPFDVLPIPNSPHLTFLFKLYKSTTPLNALATNASSTWWSFISCSAALLHATLATWALYGLLVCRGVEGLNLVEWGLKHKSEAIAGVNRGIREGSMGRGSGVSDEVLGCVVIVANFENLQGTYDAAHLHIVALRRMVHARGGLDSLHHNSGLVRGIIWTDFHTSTAHHTPPSFPFFPPFPSNYPLPDPFHEEAAFTSPTSLLYLPLAAIASFNIFYRLHRLGLAFSPRWLRHLDRHTLSDMLYEVEYMILNVEDYSRVYVDFDLDLGVEQGEGEEYESRKKEADAAAVVEGVMGACQIFVYAGLRGLPGNARIFGILEERVRRALDRPSANSLYEIWNELGNANVLLWVLVMACSVAAERGWYVGRVVEVVGAMGLETEVEMETVLRNVAWVDGYLDRVMTEIWSEVGELKHRAPVVGDALDDSVHADLDVFTTWDIQGSEQGSSR